MFRKFDDSDIVRTVQAKSSVARGIKKTISEDYEDTEGLEIALNDFLFPKKVPVSIASCKSKANLLQSGGVTWFFQTGPKEPWLPTLQTLYKFPDLLPTVGVDRGAVPFVLKGARIMCQGLTSPGGSLPEENLEEGEIVAITAEGKGSLPIAIGQLTMSTDEIKSVNSGPCLDSIHHLGDGLWSFAAGETWTGHGAELAEPRLKELLEEREAKFSGPIVAFPEGAQDEKSPEQQQQKAGDAGAKGKKRTVMFDGEELELTDSSEEEDDSDDEGDDDEEE